MVHVYVLSDRTGHLGVGLTRHINRYMKQHRQEIASSCAREHQFDRLLLLEFFGRSADAKARETQINGYSLSQQMKLIRVANPRFDDLALTLPPLPQA
jgi:putative endonuclease